MGINILEKVLKFIRPSQRRTVIKYHKQVCGAYVRSWHINYAKGFTLIEAIIALAVFALLAAGTFQAWRYVSGSYTHLHKRAVLLENARAAMDALTMNLQLAEEIDLNTANGDGTLVYLSTRQREKTDVANSSLSYYVFTYDSTAVPKQKNYHVLRFGGYNEFASGIADVKLVHDKDKETMRIKIKTEEPAEGRPAITLETSVDMRHKVFE